MIIGDKVQSKHATGKQFRPRLTRQRLVAHKQHINLRAFYATKKVPLFTKQHFQHLLNN